MFEQYRESIAAFEIHVARPRTTDPARNLREDLAKSRFGRFLVRRLSR